MDDHVVVHGALSCSDSGDGGRQTGANKRSVKDAPIKVASSSVKLTSKE
jgi:hypothetical protein